MKTTQRIGIPFLKPITISTLLFSLTTPNLLGDVILSDDDGWYVNTSSPEYDAFLKGEIADIPYKAPLGIGSAQINTLWSSAHNLRTLAQSGKTSVSSLSFDKSLSLSATGFGNYFTQENQVHASGYHYRALGSALRLDYKNEKNWRTGAAFGYLSGTQNSKGLGTGSLTQHETMGLLYLSHRTKLDDLNTIQITLTGAYGDTKNKGTLSFNELYLQPDFSGSWKDKSYWAELKTEWLHQLTPSLVLNTSLGIEYTFAQQNDNSIANGLYSFKLTDADLSFLRTNFGSELTYSGNIFQKNYQASIGLGIYQDLIRNAPSGRLIGKSHSWTISGSKPGHTGIFSRSGISINLANNLRLNTYYTLECSEYSLLQSGEVGLTFTF